MNRPALGTSPADLTQRIDDAMAARDGDGVSYLLAIGAELYSDESTDVCDCNRQRADLFERLGVLLRQFGDDEGGRGYLKRCVSVRRQLLGDSHPAVFFAMRLLLTASVSHSDAESAEVGRLFHTVAPDHMAQLRDELQQVLSQERTELAFRIADELAQCELLLHGEASVQYASSLANLAIFEKELGSFSSAEGHYLRAIEILRDEEGREPSVHLAKVLNNAAQLMMAQGRPASAESLYREAVSRMRDVVGADRDHFHDVVKELYAFVARGPSHANKDESTAARVAEAVDRIQTLGMLTANLATALHETNKKHEAETLLAFAVALLRDLLGPEHPAVIQTLIRQAAHRHAEQPGQAMQIVENALGRIQPPQAALTPLPELQALFASFAGPRGVEELSPADLQDACRRCEREFCDGDFGGCFRTAMSIVTSEPSLEFTQLMLLSIQYLDGPAGLPGARIAPMAQMLVEATSGNPWPNTLLRLATGDANIKDVLRDVQDDSRRCQALFYASWHASLSGNMVESESLHRACVALDTPIFERRIGDEMGPPPPRARNPVQAAAIGRIGVQINALMRAGRPGEALHEAERAWQLARAHLDPRDRAYQNALYLRGSVAVLLRDWDRAEELLNQVLALLGPPGPRDVALRSGAMNSLALLRIERGQYAEAEKLLAAALQSLDGCEARGPSLANVMGDVLGNLAEIKREQFGIESAVLLYDRAIELLPDTPGLAFERARTLRNASAAYLAVDMTDEAVRLLRMALAIYERDLPEGDLELERMRHALAAVDSSVATPAMERTLLEAIQRLRGAASGSGVRLASYLTQLARWQARSGKNGVDSALTEAIEVLRRELGDRHPQLGRLFLNLAVQHAGRGKYDLAVEAIRSAEPCEELMLQSSFGMGSERRRMVVGQRLQIGMHFALELALLAPESAIAAETAANLVLRRKAVALELQARTRESILRGRHPELQKELDQLLSHREKLANSHFVGAGGEGKVFHATYLAELQSECDRLEDALTQKIPQLQGDLHQRARVDCALVGAALPRHAAVIEYVKQPVVDFTRLLDPPSAGEGGHHRYVAILLRDGDCFPRLVDLGEATELERLNEAFRDSIEKEEDLAPDESWRNVGESLRQRLVDPLLPHLEGRRTIFVAMDGELCRTPFHVLPTVGGKCLLDEYEVCYVGTARDILGFDRTRLMRAAPALVIGDPDFDLRAIGEDALSFSEVKASGEFPSRVSRGMREVTLAFDRLPGTAREVMLVADLLEVSPVTGAMAVEARLLLAKSPAVLHVSTHGFYLAQGMTDPAEADDLRAKFAHVENPLLRSGLVFAGANAWLAGEDLSPQIGDGIVTAADVTGIDLTGTQLVVLAACESALGHANAGEGVFGMRRAFHIAGAATLVTALWEVPDAMTQLLMVSFYEKIRSGQGCAEALRNAQLELKTEGAHPFSWGAFICQGDPSALDLSPASEHQPSARG